MSSVQQSVKSKAVTIIGAGSWGTALAILLARNGYQTRLWGRDVAHMESLKKLRFNQRYLPDFSFPDNLEVCVDLAHALQDAPIIILAVPSSAIKEQVIAITKLFNTKPFFVLASKGLEPESNRFLHEIIQEVCADATVAVLAGPSFAKEVAAALPTAVTLSSMDLNFAQNFGEYLHHQTFRVYHNDDVVGAELGGVLKNIYAIGAGIADGLGFGANARSALMTRSLSEMIRLGMVLGAKPQTLIGLAGMGDLVLSCTDDQSRNRRLGLALGQGIPLEVAIAEIGQVVEGQRNAKQVYALAKKHHVEMPIAEQIYHVLNGSMTPVAAVENLLAREQTTETSLNLFQN